ncbi:MULTISPECIES: serine/threonine-protein kinase [unclassified Streptomyces]|uniref:serine/threonine-protein kinase n=1 Tax=unclassified Streptomyces TaxID=2593676 RepID=UPI0006C52865|nr:MULTISPECIES: serine/threonine-protein kinase [unclassified Streptomyces]KOX23136.1 serine/threonine protein kinase [Streptomyces sp. NRRL F-6491]KOX40194.1 serine/threonine protein kinase [Streptomyces sp. NRRL F-6492]
MLGPLREGAPRRIGPYEVLARLGAGGMGEVFLARGAGTDSGAGSPPRTGPGAGSVPGAAEGAPPVPGAGPPPGAGGGAPPVPGAGGPPGAAGGPGRAPVRDVFVAVKTVRRDVAGDPAFRDRFRREIRIASLVDSAYAAAPVGGDADAETPWLATAYVPGPSLSQAVRRGGALPVDAVRALGAGVARALADLHRAGVLHRDLKPGNVMLSVDGPRLIDFGIARSSTATTMTATGVMVGSPSFMSPEHVAGARRVTTASDVFCLGSLLCYAATGEDPFGDGPLAAVLYRVSRAEADLSRVPEELRGAVAACLAVDPAARPAPERLVELLGPAPAKVFPWPEGVREHIGEYGRELAQLVASGGPLLEAPAGFGPVVGPASRGLHSAPTLAPAGLPRRRPRRGRLLAAVLAPAVVAGGAGAYLLWPEGGGEGKAPAKAAGPRVPGVDDRGPADTSGFVAQNAAQRPAGWRPWRAKLGAPAFGCSAGEAAVVCRTTDGRYEALDPADGKRLWAADLVDDPRDDQSFIGPTGGVFVAGGTGVPAVHGPYAVLLSGGRLQVRDARSGTVRWEKEGPGGGGLATRPVVADGTVFVPTGDDTSGRMTAFALADGRERWSKALTNADLSRAEYRDFEPVAYANGLVYALSDAGFVAYDARTGDQRGQVPPEAEECDALLVRGRYAYCAPLDALNTKPLVLHRLDAVTLSPVGPGRLAVPAGVADSGAWPTAVSDRAAVVLDAGPMRWASSGNKGEPGGVYVLDPATGKSLGHYPLPPLTTADGRRQLVSNPLITGSALVYADFSALRVVPLGADGRPGAERAVPVPGAPGPRADEEYDLSGGTYLDREVRPPLVLPLGGVAHVVYDKGVVVSVGLPREALGEAPAPAAGEKE